MLHRKLLKPLKRIIRRHNGVATKPEPSGASGAPASLPRDRRTGLSKHKLMQQAEMKLNGGPSTRPAEKDRCKKQPT
jgi:hypothetical protein